MKTARIIVQHPHGLHARPAARLVRLIKRFHSEVRLRRDSLKVNGRSILGILMLAATLHSQLVIEVEGDDEADAFQAVREFLENAREGDDDSGQPS